MAGSMTVKQHPVQRGHKGTHLRLSEDSVNSQNMIKHFIEQHQGHIKFLFIKHLFKIGKHVKINDKIE